MKSTSDLAVPCHVDTVLTLPRQTGSRAIAAACRDTALAFVHEALHWGKAELAMWLMGPYAQVVQNVGDASSRRSGELGRAVPLLREIDARLADRVIVAARNEVLDALARTSDAEGMAAFAIAMVSSGFVVRAEDENGVEGWVPTSAPRRLADRVLSLFAADYLTRPAEYETDLTICAQCKKVEFDQIARFRGVCEDHAHASTPPQAPRTTLPYFMTGS